jgi:3-isopropylmalate/(R)-2-methylmalate dehydratase small subunit
MQSFTSVTSAAAPLMVANVDTITIAPFGRLANPDDGIGSVLYYQWRFNEDGTEKPDFVLNQAPFREARIIISGPNFGCGSARETAVSGHIEFGVTCIIAPSFSEIFYNNCFKNGLLPVELDEMTVNRLADEAAEGEDLTVDLERKVILSPTGEEIPFDIPDFRRQQLLEGVSEVHATLEMIDQIRSFQERDRQARPWIYL